MFGFKRAEQKTQQTTANEQNEFQHLVKKNEDDLKRHIQALLDNDLTSMPSGDNEITRLLAQLAGKLLSHVKNEMGRCVNLSIELNETAIFSAQMLSELKEVNEQTQGIAAAAEEMVATVKEIDRYGSQIADQAKEAHDVTQTGSRAVQNASTNIGNIRKTVENGAKQVNALAMFTDQISGIAEDIKDIAEQTNLLALNATIEAARAGEAGKGFAVVASEVKELANQTAKSTEEISEIINNLQGEMKNVLQSMEDSTSAVENGQNAMVEVNERMQEICQKIDTVTENTSNISHTLVEQSQAANEVAQGIATIAKNSVHSVKGVERIVTSMDTVEKLISDQIDALAVYNVPHKVIKLAQSDHVLWKKRLANMIAGRTGLNANELADHHSCRLGKWYDQVSDKVYLDNPAFQKLREPHRLVHTHGIEAVKLFNTGKTKDAIKEIEKVKEASKDVLNLLAELERSSQ